MNSMSSKNNWPPIANVSAKPLKMHFAWLDYPLGTKIKRPPPCPKRHRHPTLNLPPTHRPRHIRPPFHHCLSALRMQRFHPRKMPSIFNKNGFNWRHNFYALKKLGGSAPIISSASSCSAKTF